MAITKTITIPQKQLEAYNKLMQAKEVDYEFNCIPRYSTINSWTVNLGNGYEADIKVCSGNEGDPLWCEGVLFHNGCECCCTDIEDQLDGEYQLEINEEVFTIIVKGE